MENVDSVKSSCLKGWTLLRGGANPGSMLRGQSALKSKAFSHVFMTRKAG